MIVAEEEAMISFENDQGFGAQMCKSLGVSLGRIGASQEEERVRACRVQQWQALVMRVFVRASLCRLACGRQVMQPARQKARGHSNLRDEVRSMLECR